jgi:hypothetical protein
MGWLEGSKKHKCEKAMETEKQNSKGRNLSYIYFQGFGSFITSWG